MGIKLKELIGLTKELPEEYFEEAFEKLSELKEKAESEKPAGQKLPPLRIPNDSGKREKAWQAGLHLPRLRKNVLGNHWVGDRILA